MPVRQSGEVMNPVQPPVLPAKTSRWTAITLKLLFIAGLVLLLQAPLHLVNSLQQERRHNNTTPEMVRAGQEPAPTPGTVFEAYRMVERALKHSVLVLALVFSAFFLFETLTELRLHPVHYGLVGGAMGLFYLALLALGEVLPPGVAYVGAAGASSLLITCYSAAVLRSWVRASVIGLLLAVVHGILYVVLRMENFALLAGTAALFVALAIVMFLTRNVDWHTQDAKTTGGAA
jgi:inner membrane protein